MYLAIWKNEETGEKSWLKGQEKEKLEAYLRRCNHELYFIC